MAEEKEEISRLKKIILEVEQQLSGRGKKPMDIEGLPRTSETFMKLVTNKYTDLYHDTIFVSHYNQALTEAVKESGKTDLLKYKLGQS